MSRKVKIIIINPNKNQMEVIKIKNKIKARMTVMTKIKKIRRENNFSVCKN